MTDNIQSLLTRGKKGEGRREFFSVFETGDARLDLRWEDGFRCSLPYMHLHDIRFTSANEEGTEEIVLHFPGFSVVRIVGTRLSALHDALGAQRVSWVRERANDEEIVPEALSVALIEYTSLTDWRLDVEALIARRDVLLKD
jgi:hypothetical protein